MKQRKTKYHTFYHSGDAGDLIAFLPVMRELGGGYLALGHNSAVPPTFGPRERMTPAKVDFLYPLLIKQPYIKKITFKDDFEGAYYDLTAFRTLPWQKDESLTHWQGRYLGLNSVSTAPWLKIDSSRETVGRTVIARSPRYHNHMFRWTKQLAKAKNPIFIGLPEEHHKFSMSIATFPHRKVKDASEMAQLIAGSNLFIGNQSFPCWLAMGMGHKLIQETWPQCQNSRIERENAEFVLNDSDGRMSQLPWEQPLMR